jgi:DNA-binding PadR family transcriptional regulator
VSIEYTILGVLMEEPAHGYSIKKYLIDNFSKNFGINDGQLYPALSRLERRGWISKRVVPQRRNPAKHLYRVTPEGREAFDDWLATGDSEVEPVRFDFWKHDFLQRCTFFSLLEPERVEAQVVRKLAEVSLRIQDLEGVLERMEERHDDPYRRMIVEYGIRYQRMRREWLEELLAKAVHPDQPAPLAARAR